MSSTAVDPGGGASSDRGRDVPAEPTDAHAYLRGVGGVRLFFRSWERPDADAAVLLVHGLGDHSGRWAEVARAFSSAGVSVYAADLRGHGRSLGRRGHAASFEHLLRDLDRVRRAAAARGEGRRFVLLGHSLGGLVVLRYLQSFRTPSVAGAVAAAPFVRLRAGVPGWKLALGRAADRWLPGLTMDSEMEPELLMRRPGDRERHRRDPLVHRRISARMWGEMQRAARRLQEEPGSGRPVLLQVAGADRVVDAGAVEGLLDDMGSGARLERYPEAYHDLYHDPAASAALRDALAWIRDPGAPG